MQWVLTTLWVGTLGLSLLLTGSYVEGLVRDQVRAGDPSISLDLARASDWRAESFRAWRTAPYALSLLSSAQTPTSGIQFRGEVEVRILDPSGREYFRRRYEPSAADHFAPEHLHWTVLDTVTVPAQSPRSWTFAVRVISPDSLFRGEDARIQFRPPRFEPGIAGILYDLVIFPAAFLGFLSLVPGAYLRRRGRPTALRISIAWSVLVGLFLLTSGVGR